MLPSDRRRTHPSALVACGALCVALAVPVGAGAEIDGPEAGRTGAPGESTCARVECHRDNELNSGPGMLTIMAPAGYLPGEIYEIVILLEQTGQMAWGFQMTALDDLDMRAGTFASLDLTTQTLTAFGRQWIEHTSDGIALGTPDMNSWTVRWAAPASDVGPVTFYAAGNAANGDGENMVMGVPSSAGDFIYTTSVTVPVPEPGSTAAAAAALVSLAALGARARRRRC